MAELTTLARPYAKAAFEYAKENNAINEWEMFLSVAERVVSEADFTQLLHNPAISYDKKAALLIDLCSPPAETTNSPVRQVLDSVDLPEGVNVEALVQSVSPKAQASKALTNFVLQLAENERLALLPEIKTHYSKLKSQELKQVDAHVTSAFPLTDEQRQMLQKSLAEREQAIVILHEAVDPSLLGGATIKVGDKFTDGSVRGKLTQLKTQLTA
ncbi:MAG: F0F1 ATP synthase subunit delta [Moraxella sp.]|nr:F0F1 ATP synthase subunit delta [Moraxella sp.]